MTADPSTPRPYQYALLRAVPRVDRGESINVGVLLYCQLRDVLACRVHLDAARLAALDPAADAAAVAAVLDAVRSVCAGAPGSGHAASLPLKERFGWLVAPRSTVVQPGPVHCGVTTDPLADLERLFTRLVLPLP